MKFDLRPLQGYFIIRATLRLHSLWNEGENDSADDIASREKIKVSVLPKAGDWDEDSVSWDVIRQQGQYRAGRFDVDTFKLKEKGQLQHDVDVSAAVRDILSSHEQNEPGKKSDELLLTFKLSTENGSTVDFASREWDGSSAQPTLFLSYSEDVSRSA